MMEERKLDMTVTVFYVVHAIAGVIAVFITSIDLQTMPGKQGESIEKIKMLRDKLEGCTDAQTQINSPGVISSL